MRMMSYGIEDKPRLAVAFPLAFQHVLSAFTGQIAVGMLLAMGFGLSVKETALLIQCALFITGIATIIQSFGIGKHIGARLPIVSGGSFTLITPMVVAANNPNIGIGGAFGAALVGSGVLFILGPIAIRYLHKYFSPTVTGAVVLTVGICIGATAFGNFNVESETAMTELAIAVMVVVVIVLLNFFGKGLIKQCCILIGMVIGYVVAAALGMVDFSSIGEASWFSMVKPFAWGVNFNVGAILTICAVHIGTLMEMVGDTTGLVTAVSNRLPTSEELSRTIRGGGITGMFASAFNGAPVITGSANVGIVAMTGVGSRFVTGLGGIIFLAFAVFPKLAQLLALIPNCVMAGAVLVMCGQISASGLRVISMGDFTEAGLGGIIFLAFAVFPKLAQLLALIPNCVMAGAVLVMCGQISASGLRVISMGDFTERNTTILAIALAIGIGGNFGVANLAFLPSTVTTIFTGIPGTALVALVLNMILPKAAEDEVTDVKIEGEIPAVQ